MTTGLKPSESFLSLLIPQKGYMGTAVLIYANILIFILMAVDGAGVFSPKGTELLRWGANFGPLTLTGDVWRAFTCNFIHVGVFHLIMNMYALIFIGLWLEPMIGTKRMLLSYILTGLCSAAAGLFMHGEQISAGASGAIFGLYGIVPAFLLAHRVEKEQRRALLISIPVFIGYNLLNGINDNIDNAGHVGGLLSGFLLGCAYAFACKQEKRKTQKLIAVAGEAGIFLLFAAGFLFLKENAPAGYNDIYMAWKDETIQTFRSEETTGKDTEPAETGVPEQPSGLPPYRDAVEKEWYQFMDGQSGFACRYLSNWTKQPFPPGREKNRTLLKLTNGVNSFTVTRINFSTHEEAKRHKKVVQDMCSGKKSGHILNCLNIRGVRFMRMTSTIRTGAPGTPGYDMNQITLLYFPTDEKLYGFSIVMLYNDKRAERDLKKMTRTIRL